MTSIRLRLLLCACISLAIGIELILRGLEVDAATKIQLNTDSPQNVSNKTFNSTNIFTGNTFTGGTLSAGTITGATTMSGSFTFSALSPSTVLYLNASRLLSGAALTNGQLLIGSTGANPVAASLLGTPNQITVTPGPGSITLSTPQNLHTGASPTFVGATFTGLTASRYVKTDGTSGLVSISAGSIPRADGGTGLSAGCATNQLLGENAGATGYECKTVINGGGVSITHAANSVTLLALPRGFLWGCDLANNAIDTTNDIDMPTTCEATSDDAVLANRVLLAPGAMTKQLDAVWSAGTGTGGRIASESLVNGTWHVYAFRRTGGTDDYCFSQSLTPTLPDGGTKKRRIGSILRESAAIVAFVQDGDYFRRKASVLDYNTTNPGTSAITTTLSVPVGLNVIAKVNVYITGSNGFQWGLYVSDLAANDEAPSLTAAPLVNVRGHLDSSNGSDAAALDMRTNTSGQIRHRSLASDASYAVRIATLGWLDTRGMVK